MEMELSEFNTSGYNIFSNDCRFNPIDIIVQVNQDLTCKRKNVKVDCNKFLLLEVEGTDTRNTYMDIGVIYGSLNSKPENDFKLFHLINTVCLNNKKLLLVGDFN